MNRMIGCNRYTSTMMMSSGVMRFAKRFSRKVTMPRMTSLANHFVVEFHVGEDADVWFMETLQGVGAGERHSYSSQEACLLQLKPGKTRKVPQKINQSQGESQLKQEPHETWS